MKLRQILRYLGVSDANMEDGNFRCEPNLSLRPRGSDEFGSKVELKNLNSFRAALRGMEFEVERQTRILLDEGGRVVQRDPRLARRDAARPPASAPKSRPTTTATSRSRTCRRSPSRASGSRSCGAACRSCRTPAATASSAEYGLTRLRRQPADRVARQRRLLRGRRSGAAAGTPPSAPSSSRTGSWATSAACSTRPASSSTSRR